MNKLTMDNHLGLPHATDLHPGHDLNRRWWDEVTPIHAGSAFYDVEGFLAGQPALDRLETDWLGNVAGKRVLHLQCHFGKSSIEIARRGAASVVGLDFSPVAIATAREVASNAGLSDRVTFVEADVLRADSVLHEQFDVIFTSYGVIGGFRTWAAGGE
ncbi:MAG: class I SAM-dependent methyltransferase [bacterium]|nr:class I SAM-dependent methyltransferase [bacterium]